MIKGFEIGSLVQIQPHHPFYESKLGIVLGQHLGGGWWLHIQWSDGIRGIERPESLEKVA